MQAIHHPVSYISAIRTNICELGSRINRLIQSIWNKIAVQFSNIFNKFYPNKISAKLDIDIRQKTQKVVKKEIDDSNVVTKELIGGGQQAAPDEADYIRLERVKVDIGQTMESIQKAFLHGNRQEKINTFSEIIKSRNSSDCAYLLSNLDIRQLVDHESNIFESINVICHSLITKFPKLKDYFIIIKNTVNFVFNKKAIDVILNKLKRNDQNLKNITSCTVDEFIAEADKIITNDTAQVGDFFPFIATIYDDQVELGHKIPIFLQKNREGWALYLSDASPDDWFTFYPKANQLKAKVYRLPARQADSWISAIFAIYDVWAISTFSSKGRNVFDYADRRMHGTIKLVNGRITLNSDCVPPILMSISQNLCTGQNDYLKNTSEEYQKNMNLYFQKTTYKQKETTFNLFALNEFLYYFSFLLEGIEEESEKETP